MSGLIIDATYNGWKSSGGGAPAAPTAMINVNAPLALGDAGGGSLAEITVPTSTGLIGAYLTDGTTHYPLTGITAPDGTHLQGTVPAIPASATLLSVVVQNASGDSPPLANAWESFWPTNFTIARILFWLRADKGVTGTTWTDQAHGNVFSATTIATDNAGINGKARVIFPNAAANDLTCAGLTSTATKGQAFAIGKLAGTFLVSLWEIGGGIGSFFPFNGNDIYEGALSGTRYGPQASALALGNAFTYEVKADASGNWTQTLDGSIIQTQTGNTISWISGMQIGHSSLSAGHMNGEAEEYLVLVDNLTTGEKTRYAAYIADRYGLAA